MPTVNKFILKHITINTGGGGTVDPDPDPPTPPSNSVKLTLDASERGMTEIEAVYVGGSSFKATSSSKIVEKEIAKGTTITITMRCDMDHIIVWNGSTRTIYYQYQFTLTEDTIIKPTTSAQNLFDAGVVFYCPGGLGDSHSGFENMINNVYVVVYGKDYSGKKTSEVVYSSYNFSTDNGPFWGTEPGKVVGIGVKVPQDLYYEITIDFTYGTFANHRVKKVTWFPLTVESYSSANVGDTTTISSYQADVVDWVNIDLETIM